MGFQIVCTGISVPPVYFGKSHCVPQPEEHRAGNTDFDYAQLPDAEAEFGRTDTVKEKGFYILPSDLFVNVCRSARNNPNLNETLSNVFKNIENSAKGFDSEDD